MGNFALTCCNETPQPPSTVSHSNYQPTQEVLENTLSPDQIQFIKHHHLNGWKNKNLDFYFFGNLVDGKANGPGLSYVPNSYSYAGNFKEGMPNGSGSLTFMKNGAKYEGDFLNGEASGKGVLNFEEKQFLMVGEWEKAQPKEGKIVFGDKNNVRSIFIQKNDRIVINYTNNQVYSGQVNSNFQPTGRGILKYPQDSTSQSYDGQWLDGKFHGLGLFKWKDGSKYEGQYTFGKKQGFGQYKYSNGKQYKGNWLNGCQHGRGVLFDSKGVEKKMGIWRNGKLELKFLPQQIQIINGKLVSKQSKKQM